VDELGELTFGELHERSNRLAASLAERGVGPGDGIAIMCRNHRGFVDASIAAAKLGADILYLNTSFAGPQLVEVLDREDPRVVVHDAEFSEMLEEADARDRILAWCDEPSEGADTLESLIEAGSPADHPAPARNSRVIILTSGTTGTPKGAPRSEAGIEAATALLSRLPLRTEWRCHVAAPLFHTWGWAHFALSMLLGSTVVLRRKFDPEDCLRTLTEEDCDSLVVIPVMLQRIMALPEDTLASYDLSRIRVVAASGSALPG
jgi:acyl-CoA synthetase (AMP-forming)/AMP-acid ligase II